MGKVSCHQLLVAELTYTYIRQKSILFSDVHNLILVIFVNKEPITPTKKLTFADFLSFVFCKTQEKLASFNCKRYCSHAIYL